MNDTHIKCNHCGEKLLPGYRRDGGTWTPSRQFKNDYVCTYCDAKTIYNRSRGHSYRSAQRICREHEGQLQVQVPTKEGFVYAIDNPAFRGWIKIGRALDVVERHDSYQTGDPHRGYRLITSRWFEDRYAAEKEAHRRLALLCIKQNEWFRISDRSVIRLINSIKI